MFPSLPLAPRGSLTAAALLFPLLTAVASAQEEMPTPSPMLRGFDKFLGHFEGSGTHSSPMGEVEWTARSSSAWVLNDFFLEFRLAVEVAGTAPWRLDAFMGYDAINERLVSYNFGSDEKLGEIQTMHWADDNTLIGVSSETTADGTTFLRSTYTFDDSGYDMKYERCVGGGDFEVEVAGRYNRVEEAEPMPAEVAFEFGQPVSDSMKQLGPMLGSWRTEGWMVMPGVPGKQELTGREVVRKRMGGHVVQFETEGTIKGAPFTYNAIGFLEWDVKRESYRFVTFSNMGEYMQNEMRWTDDGALISFSSMDWMGQSLVSRSVLTMDGDAMTMDAHAIMGTGDPMQQFHMGYFREDD
ncbi:MAG: hypothetical protein AAF196_18120 [Planctomycetota bacterium]